MGVVEVGAGTTWVLITGTVRPEIFEICHKAPATSQDCFVWENWKIILSGSVLDLLLTLHQVHSQYRAGQVRSRPGWKYRSC